MCKNLESLTQDYDEITIPEELYTMTKKTIHSSIKARKRTNHLLTTAAIFVLTVGLFITSVNTNQAFANSMNDIPLLNGLTTLVTFVDYEEDTPSSHNEVTIPSIIDPSSIDEAVSDEVSQKLVDINQTIATHVEAFLEEANARAEADKQAYIETGGKAKDFIEAEIVVDYTILHQSEDYLSFLVSMSQTQAYSYVAPLYYTIDLHTGDEVSLANLLGEDYETFINQFVQSVIDNDLATNPNSMYFEGDLGFNGIKQEQPFYLNEKGAVVIHFDKYEIAAGAAGPIDIEMPQ